MTTPTTQGKIELHQSKANVLSLPILIAVCLVAIVIRQFFPSPSPTVLAACGGFAVLDALLAAYLLRNIGSTLVVTPERISFIKKNPAPPQVINRNADSILTFRMAANGPAGSKYTGYALKLRDTASGQEVYAGAFGQGRVREACVSQGWSFE